MRLKIYLVGVVVLVLCTGLISAKAEPHVVDAIKSISTSLEELQALPAVTNDIKAPELTNPDWLQAELDAEIAAALASRSNYSVRLVNNGVVSYDVETRGSVTGLAEFKSLANQTLNDSRGWSRLGVSFQEVVSGGSFTLVLSEASQVPIFNYSVCSDYWSCQVGRYVIINQDRWYGASDAWNQAGGALRDYQHMVVNHETGHWLGHGHENSGCYGTSGQLAPLMQQQSMDLRECVFNPWPLNYEIWSSRLGI